MKKERLNECQLFARSFDITRISNLNNKHARIAFLMRLKGSTLGHVATTCGISQSRVRHVLLDGIEKLSALDEKCEFNTCISGMEFIDNDLFLSGIYESKLNWMAYSSRLFETIQLLKAAN